MNITKVESNGQINVRILLSEEDAGKMAKVCLMGMIAFKDDPTIELAAMIGMKVLEKPDDNPENRAMIAEIRNHPVGQFILDYCRQIKPPGDGSLEQRPSRRATSPAG